jgi:hypothetical protein
MSDVSVTIQAGFSDESARRHLSAFNTIIEMCARFIQEPELMIKAYDDYFTPVIEQAIVDGNMTREEAYNMAKDALAELLIINQRLAFMVGTEVSEAIGRGPLDTNNMTYPIYRRQDNDSLTTEEVMDELNRIMRQPGKGNN